MDHHLIRVPHHADTGQRFHRRVGLAHGVSECREVMATDQRLRRRMHRIRIERGHHAPRPVPLQR